uniref:Uncharacterized protein n=1 Tax=Anguilla anguilla TaxID=7936 RepID=A0A0E9WZD4_ANGAN
MDCGYCTYCNAYFCERCCVAHPAWRKTLFTHQIETIRINQTAADQLFKQ